MPLNIKYTYDKNGRITGVESINFSMQTIEKFDWPDISWPKNPFSPKGDAKKPECQCSECREKRLKALGHCPGCKCWHCKMLRT